MATVCLAVASHSVGEPDCEVVIVRCSEALVHCERGACLARLFF